MFWGLIMEPQRRYTQRVKKAFHISMASLDVSTSSEEPAQVMCGIEGRNYLLCTLRKPDVMQCPLDLNFNIGSELSFAANGKCHVHLTGYLIEDHLELSSGEEEEEESENESDNPVKKKKRNNKKENMGPAAKKRAINIACDDGNSDGSDDYIEDLSNNSIDEDDENDHTYQEDEGEEDISDEEGGDVDEEENSSLSDSEEENSKSAKSSEKSSKINGITPRGESTPYKPKSEKKKKLEEDNKTPTIEAKTSRKGTPSSTKLSIRGGVIIEEIKEGQGPIAKAGKFVTVYYEGRLKQNNKMFDSITKGSGFSFRLGGGEVIKGWDIGVTGMRLGGKRRIVCPPAMAYGAKGSPPAIPANSTLIFEVELKKMR